MLSMPGGDDDDINDDDGDDDDDRTELHVKARLVLSMPVMERIMGIMMTMMMILTMMTMIAIMMIYRFVLSSACLIMEWRMLNCDDD